MNAPLVSVVTATFNACEGLRHTVENIAGQDFDAVEHVIVDGASTDGTVAYLESLGRGVRWISEPDGGIAEAMNKGVAMARGTWILVIHAEDTLIAPDSLSRAAEHLSGDADIVSYDVLFEAATGPRRFPTLGLPPKIRFKSTIPHQGAFCRRDLFDRIGQFDPSLRIAMDYDFFLRASLQGARVRTVPEILARMPDTGISSRLDWPSLRKRFDEERRIHRAHARGPGMQLVYGLYWPAYLAYRRLRHGLTG